MAGSEFLDRLSRLSPKQLALLALQLQEKLERQQERVARPGTQAGAGSGPTQIAIVGMACRFPGDAATPEAYWQLLREGRDAIVEVPADRWDVDAYYDPDPDAPGKIATRWGGFLSGVDRFDADFFGIAPREATNMDPQQRLVLEVAWEALERAGYAPASLEKTRTGVFLGICNGDYYQLNAAGDQRQIDAYLASGSAASVASGRLSYLLGLQGPSLSIDTACSSSLVAVHLACQSLRAGESNMAIAGGVNVILRPEVSMTLSRAHMMAGDGRCKAFDSRADGFVRAEGCGLVVLRRLADAQRDGDPILAVIRASAANQDGRSSGITAPNGPAQVAVIRDALALAQLAPADIDYVEAHGTGTSLGDPIEVQALAAALGAGRDEDSPLLIGSAKTNVGHLESAAGAAGLIKTVLALQHRLIPPSLHLREPNPHIDWPNIPVQVATRLTPWRSRGRRLAGVSSFGFSGTNAHLILEEAPRADEQEHVHAHKPNADARLLILSARSDPALAQMARELADYLEAYPQEDLDTVCSAMALGRSHFEHRLALPGRERDTVIGALRAEVGAGVPTMRGVAKDDLQVAFLFSGQGSQYPGMGRELYDTEPVFRGVIDECAQALDGLLDKPLVQIMFDSERGELARTANLQPSLFALEVALAALWRSWGITPGVVLGHSLGEYSAACVAGMFSISDGARLVAARGRLMQAVGGDGRMIATDADEASVAALLDRHASAASVAAYNGPGQLVISGFASAIEAIGGELQRRGAFVRALEVSHGFHSPQMDPMLAEFEAQARSITYRTPSLPLVSNLSGALWAASAAEALSGWRAGGSGEAGERRESDGYSDPAAYWMRHARHAVQFERGMRAIDELGADACLEIGPDPVLLGLGRACTAREDLLWLPSLRAGMPAREVLLQSLGRLYVAGANVNWPSVVGRRSRHPDHALPTYPFQRRRFWMARHPESTQVRTQYSPSIPQHEVATPCSALAPASAGRRLDTAVPTFEATLDLTCHPYLEQHRVGDRLVAPGALLLEMLRDAGRRGLGLDTVVLEDVHFRKMLVLPESGICRVQIALSERTGEGALANVHALAASPFAPRVADDEAAERLAETEFEGAAHEETQPAWVLHASARIRARGGARAPATVTLESALEQCRTPCPVDAFYEQLSRRSLNFGPLFRSIVELKSDGGAVLGRVRLAQELRGPPASTSHAGSSCIHPTLLDAALQLLGVAVGAAEPQEIYMQVSLQSMQVFGDVPDEVWGYARLRSDNEAARRGRELQGDVHVFDARGKLVLALAGVGLKLVPPQMLASPAALARADWLYHMAWRRHVSDAAEWHLRSMQQLAEPLQGALGPLAREHGLEAFAELSPRMERASLLFVARALEHMQCRLQPGMIVNADALRRDARVLPSFERLFARMLTILSEEGVLEPRSVGAHGSIREWQVRAALPEGDGAAECDRLLHDHPQYGAELTLLRRCGRHLAQVLQGAQDPLQLLFPEGDPAALEPLYRDSPSARVYNGLVGQAVAGLVGHRTGSRPLHVLEIGAGTGSTTQYVAPLLPPGTEYVFTDISPLFVARAAERFAGRPGMQFRMLDVDDRTPGEQGFAPHTFDLVIAANVLHATRDLRRTVMSVRELLRPGGVLLLLEGTRALRWVDLTFGMTEGWWRFSDRELRPQHPLLAPAQWTSLLNACGFDEVAAVPETIEPAAQSVLLAHVSCEPRADTGAKARRWLLCGRDSLAVRELAAACRTADIEALEIGDPGQLGQWLEPGPAHVLLLACDTARTTAASPNPVVTATHDCLLATALLHELQASGAAAKLWLLTRGAQPVRGAPSNIHGSALWGWGRVAALERPEHFGGLVDLDSAAAGAEGSATERGSGFGRDLGVLRAILDSEGGGAHAQQAGCAAEDQWALRDGVRYVPRLVRGAKATADRFTWNTERTYLVTGWMGGLGLLLVRWLMDRGVRHLVLVGRRDPSVDEAGLQRSGSAEQDRDADDGQTARQDSHSPQEVLAELRRRGVSTSVVVADVASSEAMRRLFDRFGADLPSLAGVFHVAAHLDARPVDTLDQVSMQAMLSPKAAGAWRLHELTAGRQLDCFVLFSSTTALWGAQGMAHYAAANQMLDALAHWRSAQGLPALSINWGTWSSMRLASEQDRAFYASAGLQPMESEDALAMIEALLAADAVQATVAAVDWERLKAIYEARRARPLFAEVGALIERSVPPPSQAHPAIVVPEASDSVTGAWSFAEIPAAERFEAVAERVRREVAVVLGLGDPAEVDPGRGLFDMGMDSLMAVELRSRLQKRVARALPSTLTFNYPNVAALTEFLHHLLFSSGVGMQPHARPSATEASKAAGIDTGVGQDAGARQHAAAGAREEMSEEQLEDLLAERLRTL